MTFQVCLASFATYVLMDESNVLDSTKAFVSLSLFNMLKQPFTMLPNIINNMIEVKQSKLDVIFKNNDESVLAIHFDEANQ